MFFIHVNQQENLYKVYFVLVRQLQSILFFIYEYLVLFNYKIVYILYFCRYSLTDSILYCFVFI